MNPPKILYISHLPGEYFNIYLAILTYECILHTKIYHHFDTILLHNGKKFAHFLHSVKV